MDYVGHSLDRLGIEPDEVVSPWTRWSTSEGSDHARGQHRNSCWEKSQRPHHRQVETDYISLHALLSIGMDGLRCLRRWANQAMASSAKDGDDTANNTCCRTCKQVASDGGCSWVEETSTKGLLWCSDCKATGRSTSDWTQLRPTDIPHCRTPWNRDAHCAVLGGHQKRCVTQQPMETTSYARCCLHELLFPNIAQALPDHDWLGKALQTKEESHSSGDHVAPCTSHRTSTGSTMDGRWWTNGVILGGDAPPTSLHIYAPVPHPSQRSTCRIEMDEVFPWRLRQGRGLQIGASTWHRQWRRATNAYSWCCQWWHLQLDK